MASHCSASRADIFRGDVAFSMHGSIKGSPMAKEGFAIEKSAGALVSGSLTILALLLIADGIFGKVFSTLEDYANGKSFAIVAAIPALTIAYIIGIMILTGSELIFTILVLADLCWVFWERLDSPLSEV